MSGGMTLPWQVVSGATALWSDWGDQMDASGNYYSGGSPCADGCGESFAAAWLSLAEYYYTVFAGIGQEEASAGFQQLVRLHSRPHSKTTRHRTECGQSET